MINGIPLQPVQQEHNESGHSVACDAKSLKGGRADAWYAVVLSLILPGFGHVYIGTVRRFVLFVGLGAALQGFTIFFLGSGKYALCWMYAAQGAYIIFALALGCYDTFRCARRKEAARGAEESRPPKEPWLAVFLSLIIPGLGHIYLRRWFQGAIWLVLSCVLPAKGVLGIVLFLVYRFFIAMLAYSVAAKMGGEVKTGSRRVFALVFFLAGLAYIGGAVLITAYIVRSYKITSASMSPTIAVGDTIIVNKLCAVWERPAPNTIVMFRMPTEFGERAGEMAIKRVVAVGGETVQVKDGVVYVNGAVRVVVSSLFGQPVNVSDRAERSKYDKYGVKAPYLVPKGAVFLLGDNINESADSRYFGAISTSQIIGRVVRIWWPLRRERTL